jgi:DNA mismatch endonuclease (patch repair protein)
MTNASNDERHVEALRNDGWRVLVIWECSLKGKTRLRDGEPIMQAAKWLESDSQFEEMQGSETVGV